CRYVEGWFDRNILIEVSGQCVENINYKFEIHIVSDLLFFNSRLNQSVHEDGIHLFHFCQTFVDQRTIESAVQQFTVQWVRQAKFHSTIHKRSKSFKKIVKG